MNPAGRRAPPEAKSKFYVDAKILANIRLDRKMKITIQTTPCKSNVDVNFLVDRKMKITVNKNNAMFKFWLVGK